MTAVPHGTSAEGRVVSWYKFKYFQILDKLTPNHFRACLGYSENQMCPYNSSVNLSVPLHTHTHVIL